MLTCHVCGHVCEKEHTKGLLTPLGFCCEGCADESHARWQAVLDEERARPLTYGPEEFDLVDFESFALRLAVKYLDNKKIAAKLRKANPLLAVPSELALHFKEQLIDAAPKYFSTIEARGHMRMFNGGEYRIIGKIPKAAVLQAAVDAGLLTAK